MGFGPGANIGSEDAVFGRSSGQCTGYSRKNIANPTALILSGVHMLRHVGEVEAPNKIERALSPVLEEAKSTH